MRTLIHIATARLIWAAMVVWLLAETTKVWPEMLQMFKSE